MKKKVIKKRKIKIIYILFIILIFILLYFLIKMVLSFKIKNIYITGTSHLNDEYILNLAEIEDYPSYVMSFSWNIEKKLEKSPYIKDANVSKEFLGVVNISIEENNVLFYKVYDQKYVLESFEEVDELLYDDVSPRIINYIPDLVYETFKTKFLALNKEARSKISEVKYDPSEYDNSRFLLYMADGNYAYVTLTKFDSINYYNEILPTLEGKKGIIYLDSGNHFQEFK